MHMVQNKSSSCPPLPHSSLLRGHHSYHFLVQPSRNNLCANKQTYIKAFFFFLKWQHSIHAPPYLSFFSYHEIVKMILYKHIKGLFLVMAACYFTV